jgi:hypothetical protein
MVEVQGGMAEVVLCKDGMEVSLETSDGLWVVLRDLVDKKNLARFEIDASELISTIRGDITYQATDGLGSSVRFEGSDGSLKIRLESVAHPSKQCRLENEAVRSALESLDVSV